MRKGTGDVEVADFNVLVFVGDELTNTRTDELLNAPVPFLKRVVGFV